tara:strand:- start:328 stop:1647 length:1320 start_codon:yes stop_codon:yes gene_type:complete
MATFPQDPTFGDLNEVARQSFRASGRAYDRYIQSQFPNLQLEMSPAAEMASSSPIGSAMKQILPNRAGDTEIGRIIASVFPEELKRKIENIELGGMSAQEKQDFSKARAEDIDLRRSTVELGKVPVGTKGQEATLGAGNYRAKAAQAAGIIGADLATDGMRNVWWFLNAPQAVAQVAMFQGMRDATKNNAGLTGLHERQSLIRNRNLRMAAAAPAWIAASMGVGNFIRQPGYKATLPDPMNPTETTNPLGELANRYFLGRAGGLLPYEEFVKERPDVSREEYNAYKNYLFTGKSPIKATLDGIQGPEVTFMGKSIPLATGLLPMAAAVVGARRGIKRGIERVQGPAGEGGYTREKALAENYEGLRQRMRNNDPEVTEGQVRDALVKYRQMQEKNEETIAKSVIANTAGYTTGAALSGYVLESMRRALKGRAPQPEESNN